VKITTKDNKTVYKLTYRKKPIGAPKKSEKDVANEFSRPH